MKNVNDKNNEAPRANKCPSLETLSAFFDGEIDRNSPDAVHIRECPECSAVIKEYSKIDDCIKKSVLEAAPPDLNERIKNKVHSKLEKENGKPPTLAFSIFLKTAAALIICSALTFYTINSFRKNKTSETSPVNPASRLNVEGIIPLENFSEVSFNSGKNKKSIKVPDNVKQVWSIRNMEEANRKIMNVAAEMKPGPQKFRLSKEKNTLRLNTTMTKAQLVRFIRKCVSEGFRLLSPSAPQPEHKNFSGDPKDKVNYKSDFVLNKN
jgi:hypothetical protein